MKREGLAYSAHAYLHRSAKPVGSRLLLSEFLGKVQPTSQKTPMNDLNDPLLLRFRHLVIAGQAEPAAEDISAHVDAGAADISVGAASAVALDRDEGVRAVDRLHMHGLCILTEGITT